MLSTNMLMQHKNKIYTVPNTLNSPIIMILYRCNSKNEA